MKLDDGQKHMLKLVARHTVDGWTPVSAAVFPALVKRMPTELIELEKVGDNGRGRVRLTEHGQSVLDAMAWLD